MRSINKNKNNNLRKNTITSTLQKWTLNTTITQENSLSHLLKRRKTIIDITTPKNKKKKNLFKKSEHWTPKKSNMLSIRLIKVEDITILPKMKKRRRHTRILYLVRRDNCMARPMREFKKVDIMKETEIAKEMRFDQKWCLLSRKINRSNSLDLDSAQITTSTIRITRTRNKAQ